jgi:hypothetical protein
MLFYSHSVGVGAFVAKAEWVLRSENYVRNLLDFPLSLKRRDYDEVEKCKKNVIFDKS